MSQILASPRIPARSRTERETGALIRQMFFLLTFMGGAIGFFGYGILLLADAANVRVTVANQEMFVAAPRGLAARVSLDSRGM